MKRTMISELISYLFTLLFLYTAISKMLNYNVFKDDINGSPALGHYSRIVQLMLPPVEILVAIILLLPYTRLWGLRVSLGLMIVFTMYVAYILFLRHDLYVPCTCGGFIRDMSWRQHLYFNIILLITALIGIITYRDREGKSQAGIGPKEII